MTRNLALFCSALLALPLSAQTIAEYSFDNPDLTSSQPAFATVSDLTVSNTFVFGGSNPDRWLCLTTAWNNGGGTLSFTVTPNPGIVLDYTELSWDAVTNNASVSDSVRAAEVRANGVILGVIDPLTHLTTESVDLTNEPTLQGSTVPVTFEIDFVGNPNGQSSYEIGALRLLGGLCTTSCCPLAAIVENLGSGCAPSGITVPALTGVTLPMIGNDLDVQIDSPSTPSGLSLLAFGFSSTFNSVFNMPLPLPLGQFGFPGCTLYTSSEFLTSVMLDGNGSGQFTLTFPPSAKWCGAEITFQAFGLTSSNEVVTSQGLRNVVGS